MLHIKQCYSNVTCLRRGKYFVFIFVGVTAMVMMGIVRRKRKERRKERRVKDEGEEEEEAGLAVDTTVLEGVSREEKVGYQHNVLKTRTVEVGYRHNVLKTRTEDERTRKGEGGPKVSMYTASL